MTHSYLTTGKKHIAAKLAFYIVMFITQAFSRQRAPAHEWARSEETMCDSRPVWNWRELYE